MKVIIVKNYDEMSDVAAEIIANKIKAKPNAVLGLATGSSPIGTYQRLVEKYRERGIELPHIIKPECGHHPHSLEDPEIIVDFVKRALKDKKL